MNPTTTAANADRTWMHDAACRGADTNLFYNDNRRHEAVTVCNTCPVRQQCADYATRTGEQYGVWGGDTRRLANTHRHTPRRRNQNSDGPTSAQLAYAALHPHEWQHTTLLAERTGLQRNTISKTLRRLIDNGAPIEHLYGGWYRLSASGDGDARAEVTA